MTARAQKRFPALRLARRLRLPALILLGFLVAAGLVLVVMVALAAVMYSPGFRYEQEADELLRTGNRNEAAEKYMAAAESYARRGRFVAAAEAFTSVIELRPDDGAAYYGRGYAYLNTGRYDLAQADFDRLIQIEPESANAYANRGLARAMLADAGGAMADFDKYLSLQSDPESETRWLIDELHDMESESSDSAVRAALGAVIQQLRER